MFRNAKVGDKIFDYVRQEWVEVVHVSKDTKYPITIKYGKNNTNKITLCGRYYIDDKAPRFFWDEVKPITPPKKPLPELEVNTKVIVWDIEGATFKRYFSHFDSSGNIQVFKHGMTSWNGTETNSWKHWKLADDV